MSMKRMIPIFIMVMLVLGIVVACQANSSEGADNAAAGKSIPVNDERGDRNQAATAADVETDAQENLTTARAAAKKEDAADEIEETAKSAVPEFVPPQPAVLDVEAEALAFSMGSPDAPVQIVEFTDYQCPFCARHAVNTMPELVKNLIETNRVFYGIKDLPLDAIHPAARSASAAARCAGEQDAYLEMHDLIFMTQPDWGTSGKESAESFFIEAASGLNLDADAFADCLAGEDQAANVQANLEEAQALGVSGTPFFFIDGHAVSGAQPYELFEAAVSLAEAGELDGVIEARARQAYEAMLAQEAAQQAPVQQATAAAVALDNAYAIGDPDAPVTIVEYTDYQCPFCARHALQTFEQIKDGLVNTGQVQYIFKDLPLTQIHPQAALAAEAARCAGAQDQEAFLAMHGLLFENQGAWSGKSGAATLFASYAAEIGLDGDVFAACLANHEFAGAVQADMAEAQALGISGTPAFLVNGQQMFGAQPYEIFAQAVDSLIAEASVQPAGS